MRLASKPTVNSDYTGLKAKIREINEMYIMFQKDSLGCLRE